MLLLAASLGMNLLLTRALYDSFTKLQFSRIFPLGYASEPERALAVTGSAGQPSIAFWGDSRAYMWDFNSLAGHWTILNLAHGGQTSSQVRLQLAAAPTTRTNCAVLQVGINDLHPLGALEGHKQAILAGLRGNLLALRDALSARTDRLILTTIFPPAHVPLVRRFTWDPHTLQTIATVNRFIRDAADGDRVRLLDANALLRDSDGYLLARYVDPDFFLHLNQAGYERLNPELSRLCAPAEQQPEPLPR